MTMVLHRLYLTLRAIAWVVAAGTAVAWLVVELHDRRVNDDDFGCLLSNAASVQERFRAVGRELDLGHYTRAAAAEEEANAFVAQVAKECRFELGSGSSVRTWSPAFRFRNGKRELHDVDVVALGLVLLPLALVGIRRWARWVFTASR